MAQLQLPQDFKEFLKLLNKYEVEYLLIGGYAVAFYGFLRATSDIDFWIATNNQNANKMVEVLHEFGFTSGIGKELFLTKNKITKMGVPPLRIEVLNSIYGIEFEDCYAHRVVAKIDNEPVNFIALEHLKINKKASGRTKDLNDLENL